MKYLIIILSIVLYTSLGFLTFIWNAKRTYMTEFNSNAMKELWLMIVTGPLSFMILLSFVICEKFQDIMDKLLKRINK